MPLSSSTAIPRPSQGKLRAVIAGFPSPKREHLIPMLQAVQESEGFLSRDSIALVAEHLKLPASKVYGVATFYNQFRFHAQGRCHVRVCRGTACHVKGSAAVYSALTKSLRIESNQTTRDGLFSIEVVSCVGACGQAPVISMGKEIHTGVTPEKLAELLAARRKAEE